MVVYPVIPMGMIILKLISSATYSQEDIAKTIHVFESIRGNLKKGKYQLQTADAENAIIQ